MKIPHLEIYNTKIPHQEKYIKKIPYPETYNTKIPHPEKYKIKKLQLTRNPTHVKYNMKFHMQKKII